MSTLASGFFHSAERCAERPALVVAGRQLTYGELAARARAIASTIRTHERDPFPLAAVLASRSVTAYAGILGVLAAGKGYVPLNPGFPIERTRRMLQLSDVRVLVVDREQLRLLPTLLSGIDRSLTVVAPELTETSELPSVAPGHRVVGVAPATGSADFEPPLSADREAVAYLLFTSGSTGEPKGVPISHENVQSYLRYIGNRYDISERDRCSQEFELTFDLSVHDMFVCWQRGACLYSVPERSVMLPVKFIRDHALTVWFSVPSVAAILARLGLLRAKTFPSLRYSLFCGEPLSAAYAELWQRAAPDSVLENLYGPTEATIAISHYRWDPSSSPAECVNGIVPIGRMFEGQRWQVIGDGRATLPDGQVGELCVAGSQITRGYWNDARKTAEQFIRLPDHPDTVWYRTGDLVKARPDGCLFYLGRIDQQVKIRGYRVELQEIEAVLRRICHTEQVIAVPAQASDGNTEGIVAFVSGVPAMNPETVLNACREVLPDYMVPQQLHWIAEMPLNANGKIDRAKLKDRIRPQ